MHSRMRHRREAAVSYVECQSLFVLFVIGQSWFSAEGIFRILRFLFFMSFSEESFWLFAKNLTYNLKKAAAHYLYFLLPLSQIDRLSPSIHEVHDVPCTLPETAGWSCMYEVFLVWRRTPHLDQGKAGGRWNRWSRTNREAVAPATCPVEPHRDNNSNKLPLPNAITCDSTLHFVTSIQQLSSQMIRPPYWTSEARVAIKVSSYRAGAPTRSTIVLKFQFERNT